MAYFETMNSGSARVLQLEWAYLTLTSDLSWLRSVLSSSSFMVGCNWLLYLGQPGKGGGAFPLLPPHLAFQFWQSECCWRFQFWQWDYWRQLGLAGDLGLKAHATWSYLQQAGRLGEVWNGNLTEDWTWQALGVWMVVWLLHRTRTARMSPGVWVIRWGWWNPRSRSGTEKAWAPPRGRFWRRSSPDEISSVALAAPGGRSSWDTLNRRRFWPRCGRFSCAHSGC